MGFTMAGSIQAARRLVWADEPRWLKRCETTPQLKFCALQGADGDQRDIAVKMVEHCGLRQLTKLVEERRMMEGGAHGAAAEYLPNATREKLEEMTRSPELAAGLHAVLLAAFTTKGKGLTQTITDVSQALRTVRFRGAKNKLRSALFWKTQPKKKSKAEKKKEKEEKAKAEND